MFRLRLFLLTAVTISLTSPLTAQSLPGTKPLETKDDLAKVMVEGIGKYLDREIAASFEKRKEYWKPDLSAEQAFQKSVTPNRERLKKLIGLVDQRLPVKMEYVASKDQPALIALLDINMIVKYSVYTVRWPVLPGVDGEGLLLEPEGEVKFNAVVIPDADWTPEMVAGLAPGLAPEAQFGRVLAEKGWRVIIPTIIDRKDTWSGSPSIKRGTNQPHREFVYRMAYEMGRHIIGYELQRILAVVDWYSAEYPKIGVRVAGYGEGGLLASYAAAVDPRIGGTFLSGYFSPRQGLAEEPIYRNVWGLLQEFDDARIVAMNGAAYRVEYAPWPDVKGPPHPRVGRFGAAPGALTTPNPLEVVRKEFERMREFSPVAKTHVFKEAIKGVPFSSATPPEHPWPAAKDRRLNFDPAPRQQRQFDQLVDYTQKLMPEAVKKRQDFFWNRLDTSSADKYQKSTQPMRNHFENEIIGKLPTPTMPMNPRTRLIYDTPKWKGYEVVLDLYEDVICYGILLVPNDIKPGEKRPVVVCQHGLEGRPTDVCNPNKKTTYYNSFGAQLADKGYVVFAPQNPYIFGNQFRQLVRKGHPLKLSLYSFIVAQHERILDWLTTLPYVDATRIAFYGLSYGGKVAMRIGALVGRYCVVICSGDFNEWIWKNITLDWGGSYMFTTEYDMYEFDLGNTFNYAEMAGLIAPRPFMVERGHNDGVGLDEYVAFEYAKVRRLYAKLGLPERTAIEFFQGGHEIHGQGTFAFLQRFLK